MTSNLLWVENVAIKKGIKRRPAGIILVGEGTTYPGCPGPPSMILDNGTGFWSGFASGCAGGVCNMSDGLFDSLLAAYTAQTIPMWVTVQQLREIFVTFMGPENGPGYAYNYAESWGVYPPTVFMCYSQGSMGGDQFWVYDVLTPPGQTDPNGKPTGRCHYLAPYIYRKYDFGHIFRTPGIARGNTLIGLPESIKTDGVETGGIGCGMDLTVAQSRMLAPDGIQIQTSCANEGDLYTCCPVGLNPWTDPAPEGQTGYDFEQVLMQPSLKDILALAGVLKTPIKSLLELFNTMKFFAAGTNAPHYLYYPQMLGCITDCYNLGLSLPHSL